MTGAGIAIAGADCTADQVVTRADAAMYESKSLGDGTPVLNDGAGMLPVSLHRSMRAR